MPASKQPQKKPDLAGFGPPMTRRRLSDQVAEAMLEAILTQKMRPGDALPSQRDLGRYYGVSRTVIREAVGYLVAWGVIEARAGSGLRLVSVDSSAITEPFRLFVRMSDALDYEKVHEVRAMIETRAAELAAERATDEDIAAIRHCCDELARHQSDPEEAAQWDLEFHRAIAKSADNQLYLVLLDSIQGALLDIQRTLIPGRLEKTVTAHRRIVDRIAGRDPAGARRALQAHLDAVEADWRDSRT
jgi:GntR family transcriptional regulator, transcriptional repressor for pyruvate dehydrogenase complex